MIDWFSLLRPTLDMTHFGRLAMLGIAFFIFNFGMTQIFLVIQSLNPFEKSCL